MRWIWLSGFVATIGACTPVLHSGADTGASIWVPPDNDWPMSAPPSDLTAEGFSTGQVPPDMRLTDQFGQEVSLWQFYGSVMVVDVSTIWCGPCQLLAADVNETYLEYRGQGFMYLTVLPEDLDGNVPDVDDLNMWVDAYGITAPVLSDHVGYSYDIVPDALYPALLLIGRDMKIIRDRILPPEDASVRAAIESAL